MSQHKGATGGAAAIIRNDMYANLPPSSAAAAESMRGLKSMSSATSAADAAAILLNNQQNSNRKPNPSKEMLYATPLRKSDRYKGRGGEKSSNKSSSTGGDSEKILNNSNEHNNSHQTPYHQHHHHHGANNNGDSGGSGSGGGGGGATEIMLGERRILSFLKDTTQLHKKMEMHRGFPSSNFSCLAREEHFANLVQQNVVVNQTSVDVDDGVEENADAITDDAINETARALDDFAAVAEADRLMNLDAVHIRKMSPDTKEMCDLIDLAATDAAKPLAVPNGPAMSSDVVATGGRPQLVASSTINREWVLKKVAMCLEQRTTKQKTTQLLHAASESVTKNGGAAAAAAAAAVGVQAIHPTHMGCILLGSNGSGKTTVCQSILDGSTGTKGILNRKLLGCYFVNSQNPDCHNLSMFIRSIILQILSHSSYLTKDDVVMMMTVAAAEKRIEPSEPEAASEQTRSTAVDAEEEMLISELKLSEKVAEFCAKKSPTRAAVVRQQSDPTAAAAASSSIDDSSLVHPFGTHPPLSSRSNVDAAVSGGDSNNDSSESGCGGGQKGRTPKKISKIPVKIGVRSPKHGGADASSSSPPPPAMTDNDGSAEDKNDDQSVAAPEDSNIVDKSIESNVDDAAETTIDLNVTAEMTNENDVVTITKTSPKIEDKMPPSLPTPLPPKSKSCRTATADEYYEMLMSNQDILDSLYADNIEKNPDDCFKKAILFPLLELTPPKQALLLLIDSIDENYINEGNLMSTLKGRNSTKSRNIAELLSNHIHLFPKWLFLVCTAKKQNKHITKIFSGFKKITLDDLRKSHVVKDVQEYIINRLNSDFKGSINLSKEVIESLNQLYIKSNGCILYLQKVLNGIKENFFSFREIKLIPCTLNGLYLYICQKSFNKKQYTKIRPILNILLACSGFVDSLFVLNCLRAHNYAIDVDEFDRRIEYMRNVLLFRGDKIKLFHNSFCDWLVDVKFATKKFLCDVNEGHVMISMYYTLISETLCPNQVRRYIYHLIKAGEYLTARNVHLDLILVLLESRTNLSDCFYTNLLNCCDLCEAECKNDLNFLSKTKDIIEKFLANELNEEFSGFLCDFFKPNLPTDAKTLKLLIETGINNADCQLSYESSPQASPVLTEDRSQNIDSELAELLISSERSCQLETTRRRPQNDDDEEDEPVYELEPNDDKSGGGRILITQHQQHLVEGHNLELLHKGKALVHILANDGNHVLLERALKACKDTIDLEIEDTSGQTALNIAARNGHIDVVQLLLRLRSVVGSSVAAVAGGGGAAAPDVKDIDVNHADRDGWTPLRSASWGGHTEVVKLLIEQPKCAIDLADKEERTALRAAAWSGHEDILKMLIVAGANVNSIDKQGRTSLIAASYMGHYEIVEILLENGADVNHLDVDGRSALCVAALCGTSGYSKVISCLLEHGANTDQLDNDGMSPLLVSSFEGNNEVCELLLENGADPDLADFMGRTPLWAACTAGHAVVVKLLLFWGCGIDCMDSEGRTVLSIAAAQGNLETVRQLLDRGLDETHRDNAGWTPLHYAAFEGYADICTQLVESGAKIDECDNEGKTPLHLAAQEGRDKVIDALLTIHNGCVDLRAHDGKTSFRLACIEGNIECVNTLLKYGCDVNLKDADSRTTLYILALENKVKMVKYLLERSNINVNIPDSEGRTALHVASWQGHLEMVKLLISQGHADVNAMDLDCRTPLHSCAWQGNHEVMDILLFCGALPDHACKQGATALGISAQEGHEQCVKHLLQYGANPYKSDHCGRTPIKLAAKSNRNNVLRVLENFTKNDVNFEPSKQYSIQKSPDKPMSMAMQQNPNLLMTGQQPCQPNNLLNATNSTQSSNNFYENTMHSDTSSLHKRKSVISSQSTGSSNNEVPLSFTQQLQRQTRHNSRHSQIVQSAPVPNPKYSKSSHQKHSQILPNVDEYQTNLAHMMLSNDADLSEMAGGCMSPLYATPPHSPSSEISSPGGQHPSLPHFDGDAAAAAAAAVAANNTALANQIKMDHFARDTHMRIILGNSNKESNNGKSSKRSGIATNPAVRMIRNRFDSAAQFVRRTNNILSSNSNSQGSSSIGVKSGTFQWRKESQM